MLNRPPTSLEASILLLTAFEEFDLMTKEGLPKDQVFGACLLFNRILRRAEPFIPNDPDFAHVHRMIQEVRSLTFAIHDYIKRKGSL